MKHIEYSAQCAFVAAMRKLYPNVLMTCMTVRPASKMAALHNWRMGYKKGTPDIIIFEPRGNYHGLLIEFKKPDGKVREEQAVFSAMAEDRDYAYFIAHSAEQALEIWNQYRK